jgi:outer membrane protein
MKKLNVALYAVLFLAVIGLYLLHFTSGRKSTNSDSTGAVAGASAEGLAYVNIDSVIFKFDMFADRREELLAKSKSAEAELTSKGTAFEKGARDYQDKVNKGLITRATAAQIEQSLTQQQQELVNLRDQLQSNLMEEEQVMNRQIIEYITKFLADNKTDYNYQYIFGKSFGSVLLYSDSSLDITQKVIDAINVKYRAEKK